MLYVYSCEVTAQTQSPVATNIFKQQSIGHLPVIIPPVPLEFSPITTTPRVNIPSLMTGPRLYNNIEEQNREILKQQGLLPGPSGNAKQVNQFAEIERDLLETEFYRKDLARMEQTKYYRLAFEELSTFNPDNFSLTDAVYLVENAYVDNKLSYQNFKHGLSLRADLVRQIIKREKLNAKDNLSLNFAIQELFKHSNPYYNPQTKQSVTVPQIGYDFTDFQGRKDYKQLFVAKMLATGSGQCHSMPLGYLLIAEQLGAKAWLSLAPQHSFIQFKDGKGRLTFFETTNGNYVSSSWMMQSGFINAKALQNHSYLDTLSSRKLYAQCMGDLLLGYLNKFGYDDNAERIRQSIVKIDPANMIATIADAQHKEDIARMMIQQAGIPPKDKLPDFPEANQAYLEMQKAIEKVDDLGYQDMPAEAYASWLQSIEQEKKKQQSKALNDQMKTEIRQHQIIKAPSTIKR